MVLIEVTLRGMRRYSLMIYSCAQTIQLVVDFLEAPSFDQPSHEQWCKGSILPGWYSSEGRI